MNAVEKIAFILRTKPEVIQELDRKLRAMTGKAGILDAIVAENERQIESVLQKIGLTRGSSADDIYTALIEKVRREDDAAFKVFHEPDFSKTEGCEVLLGETRKLAKTGNGFFLKKEKAWGLLEKNPPPNILEMLGYGDVKTLREREDLLEVFAALRFAEDPRWLNDVFFREYNTLTPDDFEERPIEVRVLSREWLLRGQKFAGHKLHHISHLKELGLIFILPFEARYPGATLEVFTLLLHYFHEVTFYSQIFKLYAKTQKFTERMISALRGDVGGMPLPDRDILSLRIVQRYLAKDDPNDPRLFEPHVNPEVIHWARAESDIIRFGTASTEIDLEFFQDLDFVADIFTSSKLSKDILLSFDLIDNIISLTRKSDIESKYLYHQHEALWNKIFNEYFGFEKVEEMIMDNLGSGHILFSIKTT